MSKAPFAHTSSISSIAFSTDSKTIVSAAWDRSIKVWWVYQDDNRFGYHSQLKVYNPDAHNDYIRTVAFSPDGKTIVSCSDDGLIKVWDIPSWQGYVTSLSDISTTRGMLHPAHNDAVRSVDFSPDGSKLVSGSDDSRIKLWDTGQLLSRMLCSRLSHSRSA